MQDTLGRWEISSSTHIEAVNDLEEPHHWDPSRRSLAAQNLSVPADQELSAAACHRPHSQFIPLQCLCSRASNRQGALRGN